MTNKLFEHTVLYDSGDAFFELKGNASMKLSPKAAIEVCNEAAKKGLWILGIDSGHWLNPGFRIDSSASWTYDMPEEYKSKIPENNRLAIENIKDDIENGYTAFIITLKM